MRDSLQTNAVSHWLGANIESKSYGRETDWQLRNISNTIKSNKAIGYMNIKMTQTGEISSPLKLMKYSSQNRELDHFIKFNLIQLTRPLHTQLHLKKVCDNSAIKFTGGIWQQGKSEGFESCDRPIVRKRPIWVKIGDVLYRVTLKFDGWPWKTIGHLSFAVSSFVQHFIAIGEFKLELQSGNAQFGSNSTIFRAVWPWNLTYDLEKQ